MMTLTPCTLKIISFTNFLSFPESKIILIGSIKQVKCKLSYLIKYTKCPGVGGLDIFVFGFYHLLLQDKRVYTISMFEGNKLS